MLRRITLSRIGLLACAMLAGSATGCVPLRLRTYSFERESTQSQGHRLLLEIKPRQGPSLGPPPQTFSFVFAVESDSLLQLLPTLLRVELRGATDSSVRVLTAPASEAKDSTGRIISLMHTSVPLTYQEYQVRTSVAWNIAGRRDTLITTWTQRPKPRSRWFFWPWQMYTDG